MEERETIKGIREFYDEYHLIRGRTAPKAMFTYYYPKWIGMVLEVGAGTLTPENLNHYVALDFSKSAVKDQARKGCMTILGDVNRLPFRNSSFDTAACYDLLEHLVDPLNAIREMIRVSSRRVVIGGPNYIEGKLRSEASWKDLLIYSIRWLLQRPKTHRLNPYFGFDVDFKKDRDAVSAVNVLEVKRILENAGMRIEVETLSQTYHGLKKQLLRFPPFKFWGGMMWITAETQSETSKLKGFLKFFSCLMVY